MINFKSIFKSKKKNKFFPDDETYKKTNYETIEKHLKSINLDDYFEYTIIQDENELDEIKLDCCIISGFATWSAYSFGWSKYLLNKIKPANNKKLLVIILDLDFISVARQKELLDVAMHGYFESTFFIEGKKISNYKLQPSLDSFIEAVKKVDNKVFRK